MTASEQELWSRRCGGAAVARRRGWCSSAATARCTRRPTRRCGRLPELALVPAGRANNIARALGIPTDRAGAAVGGRGPAGAPARRAARRDPRPPHLRARGRERGLPGRRPARATTRTTRPTCGRASAPSRARSSALHRPTRLSRRLDGSGAGRTPAAAQLFLSNLPYFGFGFEVDPGADPADGRFEAIADRGARRRAPAATAGRRLARPPHRPARRAPDRGAHAPS